MLVEPLIDQMRQLDCPGFEEVYLELQANPSVADLSPDERLGLMLSREIIRRRNKRCESKIRKAKLRQEQAVFENVDCRSPRGLDRAMFLRLGSNQWIRDHIPLIITGMTGTGKTYLACALGQKACRDNLSVVYHRCHRLFEALAIARHDGTYQKLFRTLTRANLLILDDFGPETLTAEARRDLLEIIEDRNGSGSTLITSQLTVDDWHEVIGSPTLADAILDRIAHVALRIKLTGPSRRRPETTHEDLA
jgi:DNA replication protein DnaC